MCEEVKILFFRVRAPSPAHLVALAQLVMPGQSINSPNITFLKMKGSEYMASHRTRLNTDLTLIVEEYARTQK